MHITSPAIILTFKLFDFFECPFYLIDKVSLACYWLMRVQIACYFFIVFLLLTRPDILNPSLLESLKLITHILDLSIIV
jgi:hypothetical protein